MTDQQWRMEKAIMRYSAFVIFTIEVINARA